MCTLCVVGNGYLCVGQEGVPGWIAGGLPLGYTLVRVIKN